METDHKTINGAVNVLMVDDSRGDFVLVANYLSCAKIEKFMVEWAPDYEDGMEKALSGDYHAILLDFRLGGKTGLQFVSEAKNRGVDAPIIFLTGMGSAVVDKAAILAGADDYLVKDEIFTGPLERAIAHAIERKRMMERLKRSEARFRAVFEEPSAGMALLASDGSIMEVNHAFSAFFHGRDVSISGKFLWDLVLADDRAVFRDAVENVLSGNDRERIVDTKILMPHGRLRWGRSHLYSIQHGGAWEDGSGHPCAVAIIREVTHEKEIEKENELLAKFPQENPNPVLRFSCSGFAEYANRAGEELLAAWGGWIGAPSPSPIKSVIQEASAAGVFMEVERHAGKRVFSLGVAPIKDVDVVYVYGREITEEKRSLNNLRKAALVFENTVDGVMITDGDGMVLSVNKAFTRITGYTPEDVVGKTPRLLKSNRHDKAFYMAIWKKLLAEGRWEGEIWNRRKNGETYPESLTINAVYDDIGQVTEFVAVFRDITDAKRIHDEMIHRAYHDPLTNLPNRLLFLDRLETSISRAQRHIKQVAVLFIDLDGFKQVNDKYGHLAGDRLLQRVATHLKNALRGEDTVARMGGDEFTAIIEHFASIADVEEICARIHNALKESSDSDGLMAAVSASVGAALYPTDDASAAALLHKADEAMYRAKQEGKGRTAFWGLAQG